MSKYLNKSEVRDLTGAVWLSAQIRALNHMQIEHRVRPNGTVAVLRSHVDRLLDPAPGSKVSDPSEPDWELLDAS